MDAMLAQMSFQFGIQFGYFTQESGLVIAERVLNLVVDGEFGEPQQARLPKLHHASPDLGFVQGHRFWTPRIFGGAIGEPALPNGVPRGQQHCDIPLGIQNALALDLGRMRSQHRRDETLGQHGCNCFG